VGGSWEATSYHHAGATEGYVLWTRSDTGQAALWRVDPSLGGRVLPIAANLYSSPRLGVEATSYRTSARPRYCLTRSATAVVWRIDPARAPASRHPLASVYLYAPTGSERRQATGYGPSSRVAAAPMPRGRCRHGRSGDGGAGARRRRAGTVA
jgi:hypothetical protein